MKKIVIFILIICFSLIFIFRNQKNISYQNQFQSSILELQYPDLPTKIIEEKEIPVTVEEFISKNPEIIEEDDSSYESLISPKSEKLMDEIIKKVKFELDHDIYGEVGSESHTIAFLFYQSLIAYRSFLVNPDQGPEFKILYGENFSGRYHFNQGIIALGAKVLEEGESRFIVTLFHEYQHHLFHTLYGTPKYTDIVWKFYNELSAYIFEFLLANYMPYEAFEPHRGQIPKLTQVYLKQGEIEKIYDMILKMMLPNQYRSKPVYGFLNPVVQKVVNPEDLVFSINEDFHPDEEMALELKSKVEESIDVRSN